MTIKQKRKIKEENKSKQIKNYVVGEKDEKRSKHLQDTPDKKKMKLDDVKKFLRIKGKMKK